MADDARNLRFEVDWDIDNKKLNEANKAFDLLKSTATKLFQDIDRATRSLSTAGSRISSEFSSAESDIGSVASELISTDSEVNDLVRSTNELAGTFSDVGNEARDATQTIERELGDVESAAEDASREVDELGQEMNEASGDAKELGSSFEGAGNVIIGAATAAAAAVAAIGGAAVASTIEIQNITKDMALMTGATGEELDMLMESFEEVGTTSNKSLEQVGSALTATNRILGLQGEELESYTNQALNLGSAIDDNFEGFIEVHGKMANAWEMDASVAEDSMDIMYQATRGTKLGIDEMAEVLTEFGPAMKNLGYDFTESAALISSFEQQGYKGEQMIDALKATMEKMSAEGVTDFQKGMGDAITKIKNFESDADAAAWASENLGGEAMYLADAIRKGALDIDDFVTELNNAPGSIDAAAEATETFEEKFTRFKNNLAIGLEPIGSEILDTIGGVMEDIIPIIDDVADKVSTAFDLIGPIISGVMEEIIPLFDTLYEAFTDVFGAMGDFDIAGVFGLIVDVIQEVIPIAIELFSSWLPVLMPIVDGILEIAKTALPVLVTVMGKVSNVYNKLQGPMEELINSLLPPIIDLVGIVITTFGGLVDAVLPLIEQVLPPFIEVLSQIVSTVLPPFIEIFNVVISTILPPIAEGIQSIISLLQPMIELMMNIATTVVPLLMPVLEFLASLLTGIVGDALNWVIEKFSFFTDILSSVIDFVNGVFNTNWAAAWDTVKSTFSGFADSLVGIFKAPINFIINGINTFLSSLNSIQIPDWVPAVGGNGFNFTPIPNIFTGTPFFEGGAAIVGEKGPELINLPVGASVDNRDDTERMLTKVSGGGGSGDVYNIENNVTIEVYADNASDEEIEKLREELKLEIPLALERAFKKLYLKQKPA